MQISLYDVKGKITDQKVKLDDSIFAAKVNEQLMAQAVYVYLSNQRQSNAHTKTRADVRGGGKKPWKQKGTGRARHGSIRSPLWRGGGITFGPSNLKNYKKSLTKKMIKAAIRSALTQKVQDKAVYVFADLVASEKKATQSVIKVLETAKIAGKTLIIQAINNTALVKSVRNLETVKVSMVGELNTYKLLNYQNIVILQEAIPLFESNWSVKKQASKVDDDKKTVATKKAADKRTVKATKKVKQK